MGLAPNMLAISLYAINILYYDIFYNIMIWRGGPMSCRVQVKQKTAKGLLKLPKSVQRALEALVADIRETGPVRGDWPNYSKLADGSHHCHLNYSYVAVWIVVENEIKIIEVTYVGSRENAPY